MLLADIPTKFPIAFASGATAGFVRPIPTPAQTGGAASLTQGFPPETFEQIGVGGIPPDGRDMNGILLQATAWCRWLSAGGPNRFDAVFAAATNGYPQGATLQSSVSIGLNWVSTANNNSTNPDDPMTAANWIASASQVQTRILAGSGSLAILDSDRSIGLKLSGNAAFVLPPSPTVGRVIEFQDLLYNMFTNKAVIAPNSGQNIGGRTGSFTMNENGQGARFTFFGSNTWGLIT